MVEGEDELDVDDVDLKLLELLPDNGLYRPYESELDVGRTLEYLPLEVPPAPVVAMDEGL